MEFLVFMCVLALLIWHLAEKGNRTEFEELKSLIDQYYQLHGDLPNAPSERVLKVILRKWALDNNIETK